MPKFLLHPLKRVRRTAVCDSGTRMRCYWLAKAYFVSGPRYHEPKHNSIIPYHIPLSIRPQVPQPCVSPEDLVKLRLVDCMCRIYSSRNEGPDEVNAIPAHLLCSLQQHHASMGKLPGPEGTSCCFRVKQFGFTR